MTPKQRLLNTFQNKSVDRIPVSLYEFDGFYDSWIYDYPEYVEILDYAKDKTDKMYFCEPPTPADVFFWGKLEPDQIKIENYTKNDSQFTRTTVETLQGKLTQLFREDKGIHTAWCIEHLCKNPDDLKKMLTLEFAPWDLDCTFFEQKQQQLGDAGIIMIDIPDALCMTIAQTGFTNFLMHWIDQRDLIMQVLDFFQKRILSYLDSILQAGVFAIFRIIGPEYATEPYLSPTDFEKLVYDYDRHLIEKIHQHNCFARVHSHGRVKKVLPMCAKMNIDAIDPLEPPDDGDITLTEAREILGDKVLIGNIEERMFEEGTKEEIEDAVKTAIEQGSSGPFILCPTATPLTTPLKPEIKERMLHFLDCAIQYGKM